MNPISEIRTEVQKEFLQASKKLDKKKLETFVKIFGDQVVNSIQPVEFCEKTKSSTACVKGNALAVAIFEYANSNRDSKSLSEVIRFLVSAGVDCNQKAKLEISPKHLAQICGVYLLEEFLSQENDFKLFVALKKNNFKLFKSYLAEGCNPNAVMQVQNGKISILGQAILSGKIKFVKHLIRKKAETKNMLQLSFYSNNLEIIKYLLRKKVDPNEYIENKTLYVWHSFAIIGNVEAVEACLEYGADPDAKSFGKWTLVQLFQPDQYPECKKIWQKKYEEKFSQVLKEIKKDPTFLSVNHCLEIIMEILSFYDNNDQEGLKNYLNDKAEFIAKDQSLSLFITIMDTHSSIRESLLNIKNKYSEILQNFQTLISGGNEKHKRILDMLINKRYSVRPKRSASIQLISRDLKQNSFSQFDYSPMNLPKNSPKRLQDSKSMPSLK